MEAKDLVDKILSIDKNIRFVAVVGGPKNQVLDSRMREGVKSLSKDKDDRWFVEILAPVMLEGAEKLESDLGHIAYSLVRFHKLVMVSMRIQEYVVTFSLEPSVTVRELYERIISKVRL